MKKTISATIDVDLSKWIDEEIEDRISYRNKSHLIEKALLALKETVEKSRKK